MRIRYGCLGRAVPDPYLFKEISNNDCQLPKKEAEKAVKPKITTKEKTEVKKEAKAEKKPEVKEKAPKKPKKS